MGDMNARGNRVSLHKSRATEHNLLGSCRARLNTPYLSRIIAIVLCA